MPGLGLDRAFRLHVQARRPGHSYADRLNRLTRPSKGVHRGANPGDPPSKKSANSASMAASWPGITRSSALRATANRNSQLSTLFAGRPTLVLKSLSRCGARSRGSVAGIGGLPRVGRGGEGRQGQVFGDERVDLLLRPPRRRLRGPGVRAEVALVPFTLLVVQRPLTQGAVGRQGTGWAHVLLLG